MQEVLKNDIEAQRLQNKLNLEFFKKRIDYLIRAQIILLGAIGEYAKALKLALSISAFDLAREYA